MSGLDNLKKRIQYYGGSNQQARMNADKLRSLKKALLYSYQGATAILADKREFRCLINPNKITMDADDKYISIPFKDICLNADRIGKTSEGEEEIGMKEGDIFEWKENGSHWLVYSQRLEESAYFRADIKRCRFELEINGKKRWAYVKGPHERNISWIQKNGDYVNKLNHTVLLYLTSDEETQDFFHRFTKIKIAGKPWEVQVVDGITTPGLLTVSLKEDYSNSIEEAAIEIPITDIDDKEEPYIDGPAEVRPYDTKTYKLVAAQELEGHWVITQASKPSIVSIVSSSNTEVVLNITTGKSGSFTLVYMVNEAAAAEKKITIKTL